MRLIGSLILGLVAVLFAVPAVPARGDHCYSVYSNYYAPISYTYYPAGVYGGLHWPAGLYASIGGRWYLQGVGYVQGYAVPAVAADWKSQLLAIAKARVDDAAYMEAVKALGLTVPYQSQSYAAAAVVPHGQTLYGYTYQQIAQAYGQTDLNALYQQSARLTQNAQSLAGEANGQFSSLVTQAGENQARVAEILARAQSAAAVLQATAPQPSVRTQTTIQGTGQAPAVLSLQAGANDSPKIQAFKAAAGACVECHGGGSPKGKFAIAAYPSMPRAEQLKVIDRLTTGDAKKRMPRDKDDQPLELSPEAFAAFVGALSEK